jgi:hypothetical protein
MTSMILNELKLNNLEITPYCNFITPPDQAPEALASVLLIDADWNEIEEIALWYKNGDRDTCYNIFLYQDIMWEPDWLQNVADSVDIIVVNTAESAILNTKMKYITRESTWYYGPVAFKGSDRQLEKPLDWFVKHGK